MQTIRKTFAAVCAVLFVVSAVLGLLLFNIEQKAFSSATYKQAFANQGLYQRMPAILAAALTTTMAENINAMPFLSGLTLEDWQNSIALLLPPEELQALADSALDGTFDYLNGKTDSAVISLVPVKTHLAGQGGMNVVLQVLSRQPACTTEQLTQMALGLFSGQVALCNPPPEAVGLMAPFIQSQLQSMTAVIPDEVTFISGAASGTPDDPRLRLNLVRTGMKITLLVPLLFLFGMVVFAAHSLADWLTWWGWSFMFAGGGSVLISLFGSPLVGGILRLLILNQDSFPIPAALAASISETASAVAHQILGPIVIQGFIIGFAGLGMVIAAMFVARRSIARLP